MVPWGSLQSISLALIKRVAGYGEATDAKDRDEVYVAMEGILFGLRAPQDAQIPIARWHGIHNHIVDTQYFPPPSTPTGSVRLDTQKRITNILFKYIYIYIYKIYDIYVYSI